METKIQFQAPWDKIEEIVHNVESMTSNAKVVLSEKTPIKSSMLSRNPLNQIELYEVVLSVFFTKATEEVYKYTKDKIIKYFEEKNIKGKVIEDDNKE